MNIYLEQHSKSLYNKIFCNLKKKWSCINSELSINCVLCNKLMLSVLPQSQGSQEKQNNDKSQEKSRKDGGFRKKSGNLI